MKNNELKKVFEFISTMLEDETTSPIHFVSKSIHSQNELDTESQDDDSIGEDNQPEPFKKLGLKPDVIRDIMKRVDDLLDRRLSNEITELNLLKKELKLYKTNYFSHKDIEESDTSSVGEVNHVAPSQKTENISVTSITSELDKNGYHCNL